MGSAHAGARGLLEHAEDFRRLHVEDLGDASLHDEEVWVVDIELDAVKQVLDAAVEGEDGRGVRMEDAVRDGDGGGVSSRRLGHLAINEVLIAATDDNLEQREA